MSVTKALIQLEIAEREYERYPFSIPAEHKLRQALRAYNMELADSFEPSEPISEETTTSVATLSKVRPISEREDPRRGGFRRRY